MQLNKYIRGGILRKVLSQDIYKIEALKQIKKKYKQNI